jgi:hypothetical protein
MIDDLLVQLLFVGEITKHHVNINHSNGNRGGELEGQLLVSAPNINTYDLSVN